MSVQNLQKLSFIVTVKAPESSEIMKFNNTVKIKKDFDYFEDDEIEEQVNFFQFSIVRN